MDWSNVRFKIKEKPKTNWTGPMNKNGLNTKCMLNECDISRIIFPVMNKSTLYCAYLVRSKK